MGSLRLLNEMPALLGQSLSIPFDFGQLPSALRKRRTNRRDGSATGRRCCLDLRVNNPVGNQSVEKGFGEDRKPIDVDGDMEAQARIGQFLLKFAKKALGSLGVLTRRVDS